MSKYYIPATQTDPACLTPEGEKLANKMEVIDYLASHARSLATDLDLNNYTDEATTIREIADKLATDSLEIEEQLQEG